jgi:site-specific recombinase XerD
MATNVKQQKVINMVDTDFLERITKKRTDLVREVAVQNVRLYLPDQIKKFLLYKKANDVKERTLSDYVRYFNEFGKFLDSDTVDYEQLKLATQQYLATKADKAPATYNVPLTYLNAFYNWAVDVEQILPQNPIKVLKFKKRKDEGRVRNIPEEDIKKLLSAINLTTYAGYRDYCIILVTLDTGIRPSELFQLKESDFNAISKTLFVSRDVAKTRTDRFLPLTPQTVELLQKMIEIKNDTWGDMLFYTYDGNKMSTERWSKRLTQYKEMTGVKITPYDLRHTFAIMFLRNNGNMFALQEILGHSDLTMTKRYCKMAQSDLENQHNTASPVSAFLKRTTRVKKLFNK